MKDLELDQGFSHSSTIIPELEESALASLSSPSSLNALTDLVLPSSGIKNICSFGHMELALSVNTISIIISSELTFFSQSLLEILVRTRPVIHVPISGP